MKARKSHKAKRSWKRPAEPVKPESSQPAVSSSPDQPERINPLAAALLSTTTSEGVSDGQVTPEGETTALAATSPLDPNAKPYWWRPPDSKARKLVEKIVVMRAAGHDDYEISKRLKTTEQSVRQYVYLGKKNGWLDEDGEPVDLEAEMALDVDRKLVRNIHNTLDGGFTNYQTHEMTLELMKRRRVVNDVREGGEGGTGLPNVVAIQVVMPAVGAHDQQVIEENVGGVPSFIEGEVSHEQAAEPILESGPEQVPASN